MWTSECRASKCTLQIEILNPFHSTNPTEGSTCSKITKAKILNTSSTKNSPLLLVPWVQAQEYHQRPAELVKMAVRNHYWALEQDTCHIQHCLVREAKDRYVLDSAFNLKTENRWVASSNDVLVCSQWGSDSLHAYQIPIHAQHTSRYTDND